jgi:hypothetical protein
MMDEAQVFADALLPDPSDADFPGPGDRDRRAENRLGHEDALGVMGQGAVPEVRDDLFGLSNQSWICW